MIDADEFTLLMHKGNLVTLKTYILRHLHKLETNTQLLLRRAHLGLSAGLLIRNSISYKSDFLALLLKLKGKVIQLLQESGQAPFETFPKGIFAITKIKHPYQHFAKDVLMDLEDLENGIIFHLRRDKVGERHLSLQWLFKMKQQLNNTDEDAHNKNK